MFKGIRISTSHDAIHRGHENDRCQCRIDVGEYSELLLWLKKEDLEAIARECWIGLGSWKSREEKEIMDAEVDALAVKITVEAEAAFYGPEPKMQPSLNGHPKHPEDKRKYDL